MVALLHQCENALDFGLSLIESQPTALHLGEVFDEFIFNENARPMEEVFHHIEKTGIGVRGHVFETVGDDMVGVGTTDGGPLQQGGDVHRGLQFRQRFQR